jgi:hypothetical protein
MLVAWFLVPEVAKVALEPQIAVAAGGRQEQDIQNAESGGVPTSRRLPVLAEIKFIAGSG